MRIAERWEGFLPLREIDDDIGIGVAAGRRSFSYYRLPEPLIKLSVLKLDGSYFDVQIARTATVEELKRSMEGIFSQSPNDSRVQISWSHVWSHFCLCYEGRKLTDDRAFLRSFGIKDGVQLRFVRHHSINDSPLRNERGKHRRSLTAPVVLLSFEGDSKSDKYDIEAKTGFHAYGELNRYEDDELEYNVVGRKGSKISRFLRGLFSCTGSRHPGIRSLDARTPSSSSSSVTVMLRK